MGCFEKCFDTIQYPSFQSRACFLDVPSLLRFFLLSFLIDFWWWESFDPDNRIVIYVWSLYIGLSFWYPCPQTTNVKKTQNTPPQIISRQFASHIAEKNISSTAVKSESARISQGSLPMNPKPFSSFQVLTVPLFDMPHPRAAEQLGGQSHARSRVTFMCANEGKPLAP